MTRLKRAAVLALPDARRVVVLDRARLRAEAGDEEDV